MAAGSGIMHEEKLLASELLKVVQFCFNLSAKNKVITPAYNIIKNKDIEEISFEHGTVRHYAGTYRDRKGFKSKYLPLFYYDIHLQPLGCITINIEPDSLVTVFTILRGAYI